MKELTVLEHKNQRILTTKQMAEIYETTEKNISNNFNNNKDRFVENRHYYKLTGEVLKEFLHSYDLGLQNTSKIRSLTLWTEKGASRMCKILDTDTAWQRFDELEDTYFKVKDNLPIEANKTLIDLINKQTALIERLENLIVSKPIEVKEKSNLISEEEIKEIFNVVIDKYGFIEHPTKYVVNKNKVYEEIEKRGISKRLFNNSLIKTKLVEISSNGKYKRPMICVSTSKGRMWTYVLRKNKIKII